MRNKNCTIERRSVRNIGLVFTAIGIFLLIITIYNICAMMNLVEIPEVFDLLNLDNDFLKIYIMFIAGAVMILLGWLYRRTGCS